MPVLDTHKQTRPPTIVDLQELLKPRQGSCVSIHVKTDRKKQSTPQNRIRFKNALKTVEQSLGIHSDDDREAQLPLLEPLYEMEADEDFWQQQLEGLSVFRAANELHIYKLSQDVPDLAVVADSFHVKPLIRITGDIMRYEVLCVSMEQVAMFVGDRLGLTPMELHPDVPRNMAEALGEPSHVAKLKTARQDPQGSDQRDRQMTRYFRRLDQALSDHHPTTPSIPLILAALPEHHGFFHEASHNDRLIEGGIKRDPFKDMSPEELNKLAEEALSPFREKRLAELRERFTSGQAHNAGSDNLNEVARTAAFGNVAVLMIQKNHHVGGRIDPGTGEVTFQEIKDPATDDVIDDIAELVLKSSGEVLVLDEPQMPSDTGIAAIYRRTLP